MPCNSPAREPDLRRLQRQPGPALGLLQLRARPRSTCSPRAPSSTRPTSAAPTRTPTGRRWRRRTSPARRRCWRPRSPSATVAELRVGAAGRRRRQGRVQRLRGDRRPAERGDGAGRVTGVATRRPPPRAHADAEPDARARRRRADAHRRPAEAHPRAAAPRRSTRPPRRRWSTPTPTPAKATVRALRVTGVVRTEQAGPGHLQRERERPRSRSRSAAPAPAPARAPRRRACSRRPPTPAPRSFTLSRRQHGRNLPRRQVRADGLDPHQLATVGFTVR